jgi:hypothetical protein
MRFASHTRLVLALTAMLANCSGNGTPVSLNPVTMNGYSIVSARADRSRSWMTRAAKNMNLLYISDATAGDLYVYSYPGAKLQGVLTGLSAPEGVCVDKSGDVWVANTGAMDIVEYAHGGNSPIATLSDAAYFPLGCSIDPTTGNLAVTNVCEEASGQCVADGNVLVFANAKGTPVSYADSALTQPFFCGYDDKGNLYVDGLYNDTSFAFAELPRGSSSFTNITLNETIYQPGGVQWDGKYVAVGDEELYNNLVLAFKITGTQGKLARPGGTPLDGATQIVQFWIQGKVIIGPNHGGSGSVMFWHYPAGGSPFRTIDAFTTPIGATVSMAKS